LSGLSSCVCMRTCFVGCPKVRPPLPTESTPQIVPTCPSAPPSRAHTDAHALAPNRITHQIKSHKSKAKIKSKTRQQYRPKMTQRECVQLDHVLQMYHVGYHNGHRPSSIREPPVESATSITEQHFSSLVAAVVLVFSKAPWPQHALRARSCGALSSSGPPPCRQLHNASVSPCPS